MPVASVVRLERSDPRIADLQRLRYDVYCLEREFLNPARFPDRRERDHYDAVAHHFAAFEDGRVVATVRMVYDSPLGFPMEAFAPRGMLDRAGVARPRTWELSRLVLRRDHRRCATATGSQLLLALFEEAFRAGTSAGVDTYIAALEARFLRLLRRFGFVLTPIAAPFDWFGEVVPCAVTAVPPAFLAPGAPSDALDVLADLASA